MALRLDLELLFEHQPSLKPLAPILQEYRIQDLMYSEVSIWNCMVSLAGSVGEGELACALALVMYLVFVVAATVIDMSLLLLASLLKCRGGSLSVNPDTIL